MHNVTDCTRGRAITSWMCGIDSSSPNAKICGSDVTRCIRSASARPRAPFVSKQYCSMLRHTTLGWLVVHWVRLYVACTIECVENCQLQRGEYLYLQVQTRSGNNFRFQCTLFPEGSI